MLQPDELNRLDATLLPTLERHHLRLLAHGLRTLQNIAGRRHGAMPDQPSIQDWARRQPAIAADAGFATAFITQLHQLSGQLNAIAAAHRCEPLSLDLEQLIDWARRNADQRLGLTACDHHPNAPAAESP